MKLVTRQSAPLRRPHKNFNPHEREARDRVGHLFGHQARILIHTSVKLVTLFSSSNSRTFCILIHTSVKLVTLVAVRDVLFVVILIHTSVKLVTGLIC